MPYGSTMCVKSKKINNNNKKNRSRAVKIENKLVVSWGRGRGRVRPVGDGDPGAQLPRVGSRRRGLGNGR